MPADESVNTSAQEYFCRLTNAGAALEAAAHAAAKPVVLTHVAVGDGNGEVPLPGATATALVHEVYRREIDGKRQDEEDPNIAWLHIIIPADEGGFWIREFGIYAAPLAENGAPVLYAYGNHAPYYKQQASQGQATTHELSIPIVMSGTAEVEISVKDAGYASQLALTDLAALVDADRQRLWENQGAGPHILGAVLPDDALTESRLGRGLAMQAGEDDGPDLLSAELATQEAPGIVQPDGVTTKVVEAGLLSALGGNLLLNSEMWITESGTFTAPVDSWYDVLAIDGGSGGAVAPQNNSVQGGRSGAYKRGQVYLSAGQTLQIVIGSGGIASKQFVSHEALAGGITTVGDIDFSRYEHCYFRGAYAYFSSSMRGYAHGSGFGGMGQEDTIGWYGAGGRAEASQNGTTTNATNGNPGVVCLRWHDPAKAAGPQPAPALFAARRMARAAEPVTVNLYDPATGQGSVWREEDAEAKLAEGLITQAAWLAICAERAAEERAAWLADPATEAERFELLRAARDARLAATDYLVAPDYPLDEAQRAEVTAYRQALRDLPAQEGAPWDGGGETTPWPDLPAFLQPKEA